MIRFAGAIRSNSSGERRAAAIGREKSQQNEIEIAVDRLRPRRVLERHPADVVLELAAAPSAARRRAAPGAPRRVRADRARSRPRDPRRAIRRRTSTTGSSSRTRPVRTSSIRIVVVAMTFVSDARSNGVSRLAGGEPASKVSVPSASLQSAPADEPTSRLAAGKIRPAIARSTICRAATIAPDAPGAFTQCPAVLSAAPRRPRRWRRGRNRARGAAGSAPACRDRPDFCMTIAALTFQCARRSSLSASSYSRPVTMMMMRRARSRSFSDPVCTSTIRLP